MRQLSDLALMLGDYETAASTLRLLASDTKSDRAYKAYAGVQEALGAAAVLSGAPPSEASAGYKEAVYRYSQVGGPGVRGVVARGCMQGTPCRRRRVRGHPRCSAVVSPDGCPPHRLAKPAVPGREPGVDCPRP